MTSKRQGLRRAFTLLEVLLALALCIILMSAMMGFMWELGNRRSGLVRGAKDVQAASSFIERIEADMLAGLAGDSVVGAGIQGTATSLRLLSRGVWLPAESGVSGGASAVGDMQGSEFVFDPVAARLSARRFGFSGGSPMPSSMEVISDRIERVRFRYYDGTAWQASFDTLKQEKLPVAIEVAVWFTSLGNESAAVKMAGSGEVVAAADSMDDDETAGVEDEAAAELDAAVQWGQPDRLRVIIVPDGPLAAWRERE